MENEVEGKVISAQENAAATSIFPLRSLPISILLQILRQLDRCHLKFFFDCPARGLKSAADLLLMERFALGVAMYHGTKPFQAIQVKRKMLLCGSVKACICESHNQDGSERKAQRQYKLEEKVKRDSGNSAQGVNESKKGEDELVEEDSSQSSAAAGSPMTSRAFFHDVRKLPDELMLPILEEQSSHLLKRLMSSGPCQLQRVSETILFGRAHERLKYMIRRKNQCDRQSECKSWPPFNERGEEYLGKRFVLRSCGRKGDLKEPLASQLEKKKRVDRYVSEQVWLGSYWKVVCEDAIMSKVSACS